MEPDTLRVFRQRDSHEFGGKRLKRQKKGVLQPLRLIALGPARLRIYKSPCGTKAKKCSETIPWIFDMSPGLMFRVSET